MTESQTEKPAANEWPKRIVWAVFIVGAIYAYSNWETVSVQLFGATAYTCKSLVPDVVEISATNTNAFQVKVVGVIDPKQVSKTETRLECEGTAMLANGQKTPISYRSYEEGGQWWVFYEAKP
jgi:hypothetical protein